MSVNGEGDDADDLDKSRYPIEIIYALGESEIKEDDLEEICHWGLWNIRLVHSVEEAIEEQRRDPSDLMILLEMDVRDVRKVAETFPTLPLSVAQPGGWEGFPAGYPRQVVVAQWAAPRPGEFQAAVEEALSPDSLARIYEPDHELIYEVKADLHVVSAISDEFLARLARFPEERFRLDPRVFEETVAELLNRMGYSVRLTPRTGDHGRDVIAAYQTPAARILMLVECKRYAAHRPVGVEPISRLWSRLFDDHANLGMVVTTSDFSPSAAKFARSRGYQVTLKEGADFISWVKSGSLDQG